MALLTSKNFLASINITKHSFYSTYPAAAGVEWSATVIGITKAGQLAKGASKALGILAGIASSLSIAGDLGVFLFSDKTSADWTNFVWNEAINISTIANPLFGIMMYAHKNVICSPEAIGIYQQDPFVWNQMSSLPWY